MSYVGVLKEGTATTVPWNHFLVNENRKPLTVHFTQGRWSWSLPCCSCWPVVSWKAEFGKRERFRLALTTLSFAVFEILRLAASTMARFTVVRNSFSMYPFHCCSTFGAFLFG